MTQAVRNVVKILPIIRDIANTTAWRRMRHALALRTDRRENSTFTGFLRLPTQFEALAGPVLDHVLCGGEKKITVHVYGCSNGAEAYTAASVLFKKGVDFEVHGFDINEEMVKKARSALYSADEIFNNKIITDRFVEETFTRSGALYRIKPEISASVKFDTADVLSPDLSGRWGRCDIAFAQNFLFHMKRAMAAKALRNLLGVLKTRGAIFIDGTDIDIRTGITRKKGLIPLDYRIEKIHNEARRARAIGWPYSYWGLEPFGTSRSDLKRRYATIFLKDEERG